MRGLVDDLGTRYPLAAGVPGLLQQDDFTQRLLDACDALIAPVLCSLDNLDAYFDPALAPGDFVEWLAAWVGLAFDEHQPLERRRELVAAAIRLYGRRGTLEGTREFLESVTGGAVSVRDSGGVRWSPVPDGELPGNSGCTVVVAVVGGNADAARVERLVAALVPAHVQIRIEVRQ